MWITYGKNTKVVQWEDFIQKKIKETVNFFRVYDDAKVQ